MGSVAGRDHVPAGLVARLLQSRNGRSRRHTRPGAAAVHVPVGRRVLHLLHLHVDNIHIDGAEGLGDDLLYPLVVQLPLHVNQGLGPVFELLLVHAGVGGDEEALLGGHHGVFHDIGGQLVNVDLRVLADGHIAKAHRRPLLREHHVQHHGVEPVVIEAPLPVPFVVLAGKQQRVPHELGIVQDGPPGCALDLVVPIHHHALSAGVHGVVVDVLAHVDGAAAQVPLVLGIPLLQHLLVHQLHQKQVPAVLDVRDPRLPEQLQQVDLPDVDVPQAVVLLAVPEHPIGCRAVLQLFPPVVRVGLLEVVVLQHHRED